MDILDDFQKHLAAKGMAADPDEAAAALWLAGQEAAKPAPKQPEPAKNIVTTMLMLAAFVKLLEWMRADPQASAGQLMERLHDEEPAAAEWIDPDAPEPAPDDLEQAEPAWPHPSVMEPFESILERLRDEPEVSPDELPTLDEIDRYLAGEWLPVVSSNVAAIRWLPDERASEVEYLNGAYYRYENVSRLLARKFAMAPSKGRFVWDQFRLRGTVYGYNPDHPYSFISGPSRRSPRWMETLEKRLLHGMIQPEGIYATAMTD